MAYGTMKELNNINPDIEKDLFVRLYESPILGENCFIETHGICRNSYYFSVSTFGELPESNLFKLSMSGEITKIQWIKNSKYDYAEIEFILNSYTKAALANNKSLVNIQKKVQIKMEPDNFREIIK